MAKEPIWVRKKKALAQQEKNDLALIAEVTPGGVMLFAEKYSGVCVLSDSIEQATEKIPEAVDAYRRWAERQPVNQTYDPVLTARFETQAADVADSRIIFDCERRPFPAKTHARMKNEAICSALCFAQLVHALPDADIALAGQSGREWLRSLNARNASFAACLDLPYQNSGDLYADRVYVIRALERPGFMRNPVYTVNDEAWSYRKVLRRMILTDRFYAFTVYTQAVQVWGPSVADPFGLAKDPSFRKDPKV